MELSLSDLNSAFWTTVDGLSQIQYTDGKPEALFWEHHLQTDLQLGTSSENEQNPLGSTKLLINRCRDGFYDAETMNETKCDLFKLKTLTEDIMPV